MGNRRGETEDIESASKKVSFGLYGARQWQAEPCLLTSRYDAGPKNCTTFSAPQFSLITCAEAAEAAEATTAAAGAVAKAALASAASAAAQSRRRQRGQIE